MKIGIIGAGFTGLTAAYELAKQGHEVSIFEKDEKPGGLAVGYRVENWNWSLEYHYHHWFTNDTFVLNLAKEIKHEVVIKRPKTSVFVTGRMYQLDSALAFLSFSPLPLMDRIRMLLTLGALRINPFWKPLEKIKATQVLPKLMGEKAWKMLWEPQLYNKMGKYAGEISLVWFWTRINKRTSSLAYPKGGFLEFAMHLLQKLKEHHVQTYFGTEIINLEEGEQVSLKTKNAKGESETQIFDAVIVTVPSNLFRSFTPQLPETYTHKFNQLKSLGASNMLLRLNKPFFPDSTYWLSICEPNSPVMVVIEHTNLMNKSHYNNEHLLYIGNYPQVSDETFSLDKKALLKRYDPVLKRINPDYQKALIDYDVFRSPYAQPIVPVNYSKMILPHITPLPHVFLANMEQVYPWDRGTNYAVELGQKIARIVVANQKH